VKNWNNYIDHIKTTESTIWKQVESTSDDSTNETTDCHNRNGTYEYGKVTKPDSVAKITGRGSPRLYNLHPHPPTIKLLEKLVPNLLVGNHNTVS
jgi:hypothetical protein